MNETVLVVEDNGIAAMEIKEMLVQMGYHTVYNAGTYEKAIRLYKAHHPILVLLDIHLSDEKDGIDVARYIRQSDNTPIIYLTSYHDEETIQRASLTKPSNYLNKPFVYEHLQTAIALALCMYRNTSLGSLAPQQITTDYSYDHVTGNLFFKKDPVHLTNKERRLIEFFCEHPGECISSSVITNYIWMGDAPLSSNALSTLIYRLNKKLPQRLIESTTLGEYRLVH